jgi:hypothetical protein
MGQEPGAGLMSGLEGRAEALAGTFNAQDVANTLWAYATMGREPGAGLMRELEGRAEALVGLNTAELCQLHQFFVGCSVEPRLGVEAINDMQSLKEACRWAFEGTKTAPSATQQQVSETLCHMGLSVEDEARCPKSGYSIDMLVHDSTLGMGGESSSSASTWAVEFDGPDHFLASRAPTGATLLKRRHLRLLGHALVSVPYWEWSGCKGAGEREQYLKSKLAECGPAGAQCKAQGKG